LRENVDLISRQRVAKSRSPLGERPDRMQMIRENNYRVDREWMTSMSLAKRKA